MRIRTLAAGVALAAAAVGLSPGTASADMPYAATAAAPFAATIRCDEAAGTVTAAVSGGVFAAGRMTVRFIAQGSYVPASGGAAGQIPGAGTTLVPTTTRADGSVAVTGYSRPWPAADYAFYTETVQAEVFDQNGVRRGGPATATCTRDTRTAATLSCDPVGRTVTAAATATRYPAGSRTRVAYYLSRFSYQTAPGEPVVTGSVLGPVTVPEASHVVTADASGAWSDVGYVHQRPNYYHYQEWVEVRASTGDFGLVVGRAELTCSW